MNCWANETEQLVQTAHQLACAYGLASIDALHVAAAIAVGAEGMITTKKRTKLMHRVPNIRFVSNLNLKHDLQP